MSEYGYFDDQANEYVITTPLTPRPWENRIWNDRLNIQITNHGTGISYERDKAGRFILFNYSWKRFLYVYDRDDALLWSPCWYPVNTELDYYECRHGLNYTEITGGKNGIRITLKITAHQEDAAEIWCVDIDNMTDREKNIQLISFYQTDLSFKDPYWGEANRYRGSYNESTNTLFVKNHSHKRDLERYAVAFHSDTRIDHYEMDPEGFLKYYSSFAKPSSIINNDFSSSTPDKGYPCLCTAWDLEMGPNRSRSIQAQLFSADDKSAAKAQSLRYAAVKDPYGTAREFHEKENTPILNRNTLRTGDSGFDRFVNIWIKHQLHYNADWNRGWATGFRDAMQDCDAWRMYEPLLVRNRLIQAARHIYADGHTVRKWGGIDDKLYFDGGIWFVNTLADYVRETGETSLLETELPYLDKGTGTVLEHAEKTMDFLYKQRGPGGICRMGYGDWNDAIEGIDRMGKGESVWTTMAFIWSLKTMSRLFEYMGNPASVKYGSMAGELSELLNKDYFDGDRYIRAVTDEGRRIGTEENGEGKIFLNPQSWSLISGVASPEHIPLILNTVDEKLETPWGPCLLAPAFTEYHADVGRISADPAGFAENGANYVHASMFYAFGLVQAGLPDEALKVLKKVLPSNPEHGADVSGLEPYNITNAYEGRESAHAGRAMFAWRTGSAGWFIKVIWDGLLGIVPDYQGLRISAVLPETWRTHGVEAHRIIRGKPLQILFYQREDKPDCDLIVENNCIIPYSDLKQEMTIAVRL